MKNPSGRPQMNLGALNLFVHCIVTGVFIILTLALVVAAEVLDDASIWNGLTLAADATNKQYAERVYLDRIIRTSANTWSNLAYVFVGMYFIALGILDHRVIKKAKNFVMRQPSLSILYGAAAIFLGFGSFFFHGSLTRIGQQFDVAGMYAILLAMVAIAASRMLTKISFLQTNSAERGITYIWFVLALIGSAFGFIYKWELSSFKVLTQLAGVVAVFTIPDLFIRRYTTYRWAIVFALASFGIAYYIRDLDIKDHFSGPDSIFQGHAVWHFLTAAGFVFMYLYYRSEKAVASD